MKRRNVDVSKLRRPMKKTKISEGFYGNAVVYLKLLLLWFIVVMADFLLEFRFEYLWPFYLLLRSVYDSFKYQGLAFSVFFICIALTSDMVTYFLIPMHWLFFVASTYVWVQYAWQTDRGVCTPTLILWIIFVYFESVIRLRDTKHLPHHLDLCRPFAAHCIGYPVVTLGFGIKSYFGFRMRQRRQRDVSKENEFYMQLIQQALPQEPPPPADTTPNQVNENGGVPQPQMVAVANGGCAQKTFHHHNNNNSNNTINHNSRTTSVVAPPVMANGHVKTHRKSAEKSISNSTNSNLNNINNNCSSSGSTNSSCSRENDSVDSNHPTKRTHHHHHHQNHQNHHQNGSIGSTTSSSASSLSSSLSSINNNNNNSINSVGSSTITNNDDDGATTISSSSSSTSSSSQQQHQHENGSKSGGGPMTGQQRRKDRREQEKEREANEYVQKLELDTKRLRLDLQNCRSSEHELRLQVAALTTSEKVLKSELTSVQREIDDLQQRVQHLISNRTTDKQTIGSLERKVAEERRTRNSFEAQLNQERKCRKEEAVRAAAAAAVQVAAVQSTVMRTTECTELCRARQRDADKEVQQCRQTAHMALERCTLVEREKNQMAEKVRDTDLLLTAINALQEKNSHLENSLSAETRIKLDLFSALGEAKRQIEIRECTNRHQEKEIEELKSKIAQVLAVMPNDSFGGAAQITSRLRLGGVIAAPGPNGGGNGDSSTPSSPGAASNLDPNATAYTPKGLITSTEA